MAPVARGKLRPDRWQSPAELMPKLMQRLGLRERLRETEVIEAWSKIVGDFIAAHSTPVALREGILYVRVLQPAFTTSSNKSLSPKSCEN